MADFASGGAADWPVIGHADAVTRLRRAIARDGISHAYLFGGPGGVGKSALAMAFAQAVSCQAADRPDETLGCGVCLACRKIERGTHPDVQRFDLNRQRQTTEKRTGQNTTLTIETVRQLTSDAALRPMEAPRRFVIVGDAETMQGAAQEALLKILEEPPPAVVMLLLADEPETLLPTIQSRCQGILLRSVATADISAALTTRGIDPSRSREIASLAGGNPGWAIRAAADPDLLAATRQATSQAVDWISASLYDRLVRAIKLGDSFVKRRTEVRNEIAAVLSVWRDILLLRGAVGELAVNLAERSRIDQISAGWELGAVARATNAVQQCLRDLDANVRPRLALETMVLSWPEAAAGR